MSAIATSDANATTTKVTAASPYDASKPSKASAKTPFFNRTTGFVVSGLTLSLFMADFLLLEMNGDTRETWFGIGSFVQLWGLAQTTDFFTLDSIISMGLLFVIMCQLGYGPFSRKDKAPVKRVADINADKPKVKKMPATRPERSVSHWNQAIDGAARQGDIKKAGRILLDFEREGKGQAGNRPDTVSYNLVIRACAKKCDFKSAEEWFARMESQGLEATVCSYNTVLDACAKSDNAEQCEAWLNAMLKKGVEPNVISYATAIYSHARRGEKQPAEAWLQKMIAAGIAPDAVCYNSMIHACGVSGDAAGAEHWMQEMQTHDLQTSVTTYTAVIDACAKAGDVPRAEKWLEAMLAANIEPNVVTFSAMIDACAKSSDTVRAEYWHNRMVQCNVKPNAHSYSAVINACAKAGNVGLAETWLGRSEEDSCANDVVIYSSVIDACGKVGDAERAMTIFRRMQANGIQPHIVAYAALARPFAYKGDWPRVEQIAAEMANSRIPPNEYFLYAQLLSYATSRPREAERAESCFRKALLLGLKANDHVVSALVRAVGRERCTDLMAELCQGRSVPLPPTGRRDGNGPLGKPKPAARRF